jgi:hypothetical protein
MICQRHRATIEVVGDGADRCHVIFLKWPQRAELGFENELARHAKDFFILRPRAWRPFGTDRGARRPSWCEASRRQVCKLAVQLCITVVALPHYLCTTTKAYAFASLGKEQSHESPSTFGLVCSRSRRVTGGPRRLHRGAGSIRATHAGHGAERRTSGEEHVRASRLRRVVNRMRAD